ncbi:hypothetical protein ACFO5R_17155 [Halosolutus amylolyticus]|uniref:Uncharacterized protein n=1 Tax=Halosolutus amylolyticus TaxID=2932267 RepID=A0ABD5PSY7_9EURY|nr:hypothetical protein [Halosolutus amylolyticus]
MGASSSATVARWSRAFVATGIAFFVAWQVAVLAGYPRSATVALGLYGFVFHVVFGKGYQLIPSYFGRALAVPRAPAVHLPLAMIGTIGAFAAGAGIGSRPLALVGATGWFVGCLVFVASLLWTVRGNLTGRETATGATDAHREGVDRLANAAVPVVLAYLLVGSGLPLAAALGVGPPGLPGNGPSTTHLLAAGAAALLVFAIGVRLLPRLLVADPAPALVAIVLPAGALAPALLAIDFHGGTLFRVGAGLEAIALVGFAITYADLHRQSDRDRAGGRAILAGVGAGALVALLGLLFAFAPAASVPATAFTAHYRLALGGFVGLTIVGVTYHFYPPAIATAPGTGDRTARLSIAVLVTGLGLEVAGLLAPMPPLVGAGRWLSVLGAALYAAVLGAVFHARPG